MPKIKMPRSAPSIDMTPMVDLAFLLVTFFMLSANFRTDEPVQVSIPSSISDQEVPPKHFIMVTVNDKGLVYFNASGEEVRKNMLARMCKNYHVNLTEPQAKEFLKMNSFGCSMSQLPEYLNKSNSERQKIQWGIPSDTTNNELKEWIFSAQGAALDAGKKEYEAESAKTSEKLKVDDFKPKFILKVDGKAHYVQAKRAIDTFRDLNINNLNFVTSLEQNPYKKP